MLKHATFRARCEARLRGSIVSKLGLGGLSLITVPIEINGFRGEQLHLHFGNVFEKKHVLELHC